MRKPRIGMVGLGGIAQKAYLPILSKATDWEFVGAFSPNAVKRDQICSQYRMQSFTSLPALIQESDAIFVHSSTDSHYAVVSEILNNGKDVYVDKPLAATVEEAEKLVELSEKYGRKLMVGFNRRFSPMYRRAKELAGDFTSFQFEKHRVNGVGPDDFQDTMLDDYIHLVDTARWIAGGEMRLAFPTIQLNKANHLIFAQHLFEIGAKAMLTITMHRNAGTNLEEFKLITDGAVIRVTNMNAMEIVQNDMLTIESPSSWETTLKQKGFEDAVHHFIACVIGDNQPSVDGAEGLKTQILVQQLIAENGSIKTPYQ
ncbi:Gfo/Idh/MocA family protein [Ornithinibacillus scapharcae]|uniref:Gfo/Idh/MocA family protein n=1 Tax=Ornithinibacillus scapharcae TaxID=1147159 RepID=UPI000225B9CF|nr:Gfo/Idh/MocA family oxidoreductase [Ornithinibacillus scapharcae]